MGSRIFLNMLVYFLNLNLNQPIKNLNKTYLISLLVLPKVGYKNDGNKLRTFGGP